MHQLDRHSLETLEILRQYDTFLESIKHVADMGCGSGEDIRWWATLMNNNDTPEPYNFNCFAVDRDGSKLAEVPDLKNIHKINRDYSDEHMFPISIDLIWAHDSLQYSTNPMQTLKRWNEAMTVNGMLILTVPQHSGVMYNQYYSRSYTGCFYHYTPTNLIYMLAINGFDCRDAYLLKKFNDPWINMAVYKTDIAPMDPTTTTWFDLIDKNLLHPTVVNSITSHGYLRQEDMLYPWLDKENYFVDYISQHSPGIDTSNVETEVMGVFNESTKSTKTTITQAVPAVKETLILKPITSLRPPKKSYVK
jgi:SAM-dependent methyltransferase